MRVEESLNVKFGKSPPPEPPLLEDDDILENENIEKQEKDLEIKENEPSNKEILNINESKDHPVEGNLNERTLRSQEELNQFITNDIWSLVPFPKNQSIIGTKWVFKNQLDENGIVSKNKARLVAQRYNQQEGIDFDETYAPVARLQSIRILLAYACAHDFKLNQMNVKSSFLNGFINEEVYVAQPSGFADFEKPNQVFKLKKALYDLCNDFLKIMHDEFEMIMMDELNLFLGLQIKQLEDGIFFNQSKYIKEMLKKFGLEDSKPIKTPMASETKLTRDEDGEPIDDTKYRGMIGLWYLKGTGVETIVYSDSDYAGDYDDRKSTISICTFMGCCLTSWFSKKQIALAISTIEAEYVSVGKACQQALLMNKPF
nr:retrovirus-related Pol polyprotein from transposon TNT 1-94 [Tanacetum cinerariifolium]